MPKRLTPAEHCNEINTLGLRCSRPATHGAKCGWHNPDRIRCVAITGKTGEQCARPPMAGSELCATHAGPSPDVQRTARAELLASVSPALLTLNAAMELADWPSAVRAALGILDRAGFGPHSTVAIEDPAMRDLALLTPEARANQMEEIVKIMRQRAAAKASAEMVAQATQERPESSMQDEPSQVM